MYQIGLFPLNLIIFPESFYPLHIFENRYKRLVKETIKNEGFFGINYISNTKMFEIGTLVEVTEVVKEYPDGRMDIVIYGKERYILERLVEGEKPFFLGECEKYSDEHFDFDISLLMELIVMYNQIVEGVFGLKFEKITINDISNITASFFIAQKAGLEFYDKQKLLEMKSENDRLEFLYKHIKKILPSIKKAESIKQIIQNDGYLKPNDFKL
ncbi:MAG: LON peptidase substrate-binding domain-containing protein [Candidatus Kapaibacteriota bacterium]|jgi:Lon protease-like protein